VLKIFHTYQHSTSIFDDFIHYEKRQEEEDSRRSIQPLGNDDVGLEHSSEDGHVPDSGHGPMNSRAAHHQPHYGYGPGHNPSEMNSNFRGRDMMGSNREFRDHRDRDGYAHSRGARNDRGFRDRDDRQDRDRDYYQNSRVIFYLL